MKNPKAVFKVYSDLIDSISNGRLALLCLLDLTAAFDTVDQHILLRCLDITFGFRGSILSWLESYLDGRTQSVLLNGQSTVPRSVVCGVPQGSVLGPLLFTLYTADIGRIIHSCGLSHHSYADDNQLYASCIPSESAALKAKMIGCIASIGAWMVSNRLMLNSSKSEFMWCASPRRVHLIDRSPFVLPDGPVSASSSVRNLRAYFDESMSMVENVNRLVRSCFYQLHRVRFTQRSLTTMAATRLMNSFIITRVDYCNSIFAGLPKQQLARIQSVLNVAARIIFGHVWFDHITPTLRDRLHWLKVPQRIEFKRCLLVYKALHGQAPAYIASFCSEVSSTRRLRSSSHHRLQIPLLPRQSSSASVRSQSAGQAHGTIYRMP